MGGGVIGTCEEGSDGLDVAERDILEETVLADVVVKMLRRISRLSSVW